MAKPSILFSDSFRQYACGICGRDVRFIIKIAVGDWRCGECAEIKDLDSLQRTTNGCSLPAHILVSELFEPFNVSSEGVKTVVHYGNWKQSGSRIPSNGTVVGNSHRKSSRGGEGLKTVEAIAQNMDTILSFLSKARN